MEAAIDRKQTAFRLSTDLLDRLRLAAPVTIHILLYKSLSIQIISDYDHHQLPS